MPLFVSRRVMPKRKLPRAVGPWALDSGGFSELSLYGRWQTSLPQYIEEVGRYRDEVGGLEWVAPMDWMCEPAILEKTGLTVAEHQERTINNFLVLRDALGSFVVPVLQGWMPYEYGEHVERYAQRGVDLRTERLIGVGTICRRQDTFAAERILRDLADMGLRLHAFGAKIGGLLRYHDALVSSDSMAWSFAARYEPPMSGHAHKTCANCMEWALAWRDDLVSRMTRPWQTRWAVGI